MTESPQIEDWSTRRLSEVFHSDCPARTVLDHVTSRWGVWVLMALREGDLRFFELRERIEGISEKMLAQTLRTLVRDGMLSRVVGPTIPPSVTYGLTDLGRGTSEPLAVAFGLIRDNAADITAGQRRFDAANGKRG